MKKRRTVNVLGEDVDRTFHVKRRLNCPAKPAYGLAPLQFHVGNLDAGSLSSTHVRSVAVFHVKRPKQLGAPAAQVMTTGLHPPTLRAGVSRETLAVNGR